VVFPIYWNQNDPELFFVIQGDPQAVAYSAQPLCWSGWETPPPVSSRLAVKHPALGAKGHRFDPSKRSKLFQGLISQLTTSWVADHVKWCFCLNY